MICGYARVSTDAQDLTGQRAQLTAAGCEKVFSESPARPPTGRRLKKLMKALAPGDVVITPAVDRLSRDATDLLVIARDMQLAGGGLRSIAEPVVDTTSDFGELVLARLGVAAKLERRRILERTARAAGPMRRRRASHSAASRNSLPTSSARRASASTPASHSAALRAATVSVRRRFHVCKPARLDKRATARRKTGRT
jgi:DNA invertase Pin-like site-specific DNA recombinase